MSTLFLPPSSSTSTRPSFFEVYASQHLNTALRPAVRFALDVLAVRHPRFLRPLANRSDELFTILLLIIESTQLSRHSSLLCESFYSLRRSAPSPSPSPSSSLSTSQIILSLILDVICPYLRVYFDTLHSRATGGAAAALFEPDERDLDHQQRQVQQQQQRRLSIDEITARARTSIIRIVNKLRNIKRQDIVPKLIELFPKLRSSIDLINIFVSVLYLYEFTPYFSFSLLLQRLTLRRSTDMDAIRLSFLSTTSTHPLQMTPSSSSTLATVGNGLHTTLKAVFIASMFGFRFLQYYYAAESSAPRDRGLLVPPPERLEPVEGVDAQTATASGMCPLCLQSRVNSTACLTSGYVFCYLCIVAHVQQTNKCPVTYAPTAVEDLVRVYEQDF